MSTQYPYNSYPIPPPAYNAQPQYPMGPALIATGSNVANSYPSPSYPVVGYPQPVPPSYVVYQPTGYPAPSYPMNTNYYSPHPNGIYPASQPPPAAATATAAAATVSHQIGFNSGEEHPTKESHRLPNHSSQDMHRSSLNTNQPPNVVTGNHIGFEIAEGHLYPSIPTNQKNEGKTPLPANLVTLWQSSKFTNIYFVQNEGHVVSPGEQLPFIVYKCPTITNGNLVTGNLTGFANGATSLSTVGDVWRLGLKKDRSFVVLGMYGEYAFYDQSTNPARCVVIILHKTTTKEEKQRLNVLLGGSAAVLNEPANVVDKFQGGVESAYDYITDGVDSFVKKETPTIHKNTKWIRKGTGSLIKLGGGIVSKGIHLVSDNVMDKPLPAAAFSEHKQVMEALQKVREAIDANKVTIIQPL